ncbi:MAG: IclR family transcriptional regulator [Acidimicrobiales bacterium]
MTRPALAATRAVALLDFLGSRPTESFTLSELSRRLGINPASMHAVLSALTGAGYLARHPSHKTYDLGPAVVALGHAAMERHAVVEVARDEMETLGEELGLECEASAVIGAEMVVVARSGRRVPDWRGPNVGQRVPLAAPMGEVFLAWSPPEEVDAWLRRGPTECTPAERDLFVRYLATVRERGWSVTLRARVDGDVGRRVARVVEASGLDLAPAILSTLLGEPGHEHHQLLTTSGRGPWHLVAVSAPVHDPQGSVVLALAVLGFREALGAEEVARCGSRIRDAALAVTRATHGRLPTEVAVDE